MTIKTKEFNPTPEYRAAWHKREFWGIQLDLAAESLRKLTARLAENMGVPEKGPMGLTNDLIKRTLDWQLAHTYFESVKESSRKAASLFIKNHKTEHAKHRKASPNPYKPTL